MKQRGGGKPSSSDLGWNHLYGGVFAVSFVAGVFTGSWGFFVAVAAAPVVYAVCRVVYDYLTDDYTTAAKVDA